MDEIVIAAVALVIGALVGVLLCILVPLLMCLLCKTRRELEVLKRRVEYLADVGKKDQHIISSELTEYTKEPPPGTCSHLEHSLPSPIKPRSKDISANYSVVNNLAILPDEVRTPENLELGQLPENNAQQMLDHYIKKREQYEEAQLTSSPPKSKEQSIPQTKASPPKAVALLTSRTQPRPTPEVDPTESSTKTTSEAKENSHKPASKTFSRSTPGYEDIDPIGPSIQSGVEAPSDKRHTPRVGDYNDPIDCLPPNHSLTGQIIGKTSSQKKKTFQLSTSADDYTEVFDSLNFGSAAVPKVRAMSDSRPNRDKACTTPSGSPAHHDPVYENGLKEDPPSTMSGGSLESVTVLRERGDPLRQSKRNSGKEVVELDFSKKRFRVASKNSKQGEVVARDMTDGATSTKAVSPKKTEEAYAMVNLTDKQRYRAESDGMKKEGSGVPSRYGPMDQTVVTVSS